MTARLLPFLILVQFASAAPSIEFKDNDRVIFVGNTFIERAQSYGHLETFLTTALADRTLSFRNLGWSGDTVFGDARSYFGPPAEGFERLTKRLDELKPSVIVSCYGAVAAFDGETGLDSFIDGYGKLLDMFDKTGARIVLMSPPPAENLPAPLPNQDGHNARLAVYSQAIQNLADSRDYAFADVYGSLKKSWELFPHPLTENGLHFTDAGYAAITPILAETLGIKTIPPRINLEVATDKAEAVEGSIKAISLSTKGVNLRWEAEHAIPYRLNLKIQGLEKGSYKVLRDDSQHLTTTTAETLSAGIELAATQAQPQLEKLRKTILKKNELFFHQWRPQNETYLFGFRKHEQGNNAVEIPQFEPLIKAQEERIQTLKQPQPLTLTIKR